MKNKTIKKLLSLVLVTVMSAALLSGCGKTAEESNSSEASEAQSSEAQK